MAYDNRWKRQDYEFVSKSGIKRNQEMPITQVEFVAITRCDDGRARRVPRGDFCRMAGGLPRWVDREGVRVIGNCVCPPVAKKVAEWAERVVIASRGQVTHG